MAAEDRRVPVLDSAGPAAPPRKNGELVFEALWQGRLFGLTMALHEAGRFEWEEFRQRLIAEIADWERRQAGRDAGWDYYECWLRAFSSLVAAKGLCPADLIETRVRELAARPPGHDH